MLPSTELGSTGLRVTRLGYGSMGLRGPNTWGVRTVDDKSAERVLNAVLDGGINFIDTAPDYGIAEERIGKFISHRRDEFLLSTKCGCTPVQHDDHLEVLHTWTRPTIRQNVERSLRQLQTDRIDVLFLHGGTVNDHRQENLIEVMEELRTAGLVRFLGISSKLPDLAEHLALGCFDVIQAPFSLLDASHFDTLMLAERKRVGTVIRGGVAQGGPEAEIQRENVNAAWNAAAFDDLRGGLSPAEFILRYTLSVTFAHTTIVGTANLDHLATNLAAAERGPLSADLVQSIEKIITPTDTCG